MDNNLSKMIVESLKSSIGAPSQSLHEPSFQGNEWLYLKECLDSTFVSSVGKFVVSLPNVVNPYGEGGAISKVVKHLRETSIESIVKKTFHDL
jgi:hypothetical protein